MNEAESLKSTEDKYNPYCATDEEISLRKPDVIIDLSPLFDILHIKVKYRSKGSKIINKIEGVEYLKYQKKFYIPTEKLNYFIAKLIKSEVSFAVKEKAGVLLRKYANLRQDIIENKHGASSLDLRHSLLSPFLEKVPNSEKFAVRSFTTSQLALLLPRSTSFKKRKEDAANLSISQLIELLYSAKLNNIKIWVDKDVDEILSKVRESSIAKLKDGFKDSLIILNTPDYIFTTKDSKPYLCVNDKINKKKLYSNFDNLEEVNGLSEAEVISEMSFFRISTPKIHEIITLVEKVEKPVKSMSFLNVLDSYKEQSKELERVLYYQSLKDVDVDIKNSELKNKLYPHQRVAVKWILENKECFLGDDMGLGKTLSVLTVFDELKRKNEIETLLVICPNSLVLNWKSEAKNWLPDRAFMTLPNTKEKRESVLRQLVSGIVKTDGLIINYEEARLNYVYPLLEEYISKNKTFLCLDESQRVKNPKSKTFKAIKSLSSLSIRKTLLSGTPAPRDFSDLWSQMYLLDGGKRFGPNYFKWLEEVAELGSKWSRFTVKEFKPEIVDEYLMKFKELLLRRTKKEVVNLPPKIFSRRDIKLKTDQLKRYDEIREDLLVRISSLNGEAYVKEIDSIMEEFLRAVQVASNPRLIDPTWNGEPAKFVELDAIINELVWEKGEKVIIWSNYRDNITELCERYKKFGIRPYFGDVKKEDRAKYIEEFQDKGSEVKILAAIPAAGGVGITLTAANTAIYLDKTWNAEHWLQSIDRLHRIGQEKTVSIISLNACPIDYMISANLWKKQKMLEKIMDSGSQKNSVPQKTELMEALKR